MHKMFSQFISYGKNGETITTVFNQIPCAGCTLRFPNFSRLHDHVIQMHNKVEEGDKIKVKNFLDAISTNEPIYECGRCFDVFVSKKKTRQHYRVKHNMRKDFNIIQNTELGRKVLSAKRTLHPKLQTTWNNIDQDDYTDSAFQTL